MSTSDKEPPGRKKLAIPDDQIRDIASGLGACFATDMVTVERRGVNYMYREEPEFEDDSGWRFFSGFETRAYINNPDNLEIYDLNTIANYAPDILMLLDAPVGAEFERDPDSGEWCEIEDDDDE